MRHLPAAIVLAVSTLSSLACQKDEPVPRNLRIGVLMWDFDDAVHTRDPAARDRVVRTLTHLGPDAVAALAQLLDYPDPVSVSATLAILTAPGREEALELAVLEALAHAPPPTRSAVPPRAARSCGSAAAVAATWLGCLRGRDALARLESLLDHPHIDVRAGAIDGLKCMRDLRAVPALLEVLRRPATVVPRPFNAANAAAESPVDPTMPQDTLQRRSALVIDQIAGTAFEGCVPQIESWLAQHPELLRPHSSDRPPHASE